jgi:hypothetical protein
MKKNRLLIYPMIIGSLSIVQSFWVHLEWKGKKEKEKNEKLKLSR